MVIFQFRTFLIAQPYAADKILGQSNECQVVPILCSTCFSGNVLVFQLCLLTGTVVDNVLEQLVHDISSFAADSLFRIAVVLIDQISGTLDNLADQMRLVLRSAVAVRHIAVDQIFQCNAIGQRTNSQRRIRIVCMSVTGILAQIQSDF